MSTANKPDSAPNTRRAQRKTLRTLGQIVSEAGDAIAECTLFDLSISGARLKVTGAGTRKAFTPAVMIPEIFRLQIPRDNISVECRLAWMDGDLVGAAFTSAFRPLKVARVAR